MKPKKQIRLKIVDADGFVMAKVVRQGGTLSVLIRLYGGGYKRVEVYDKADADTETRAFRKAMETYLRGGR